MAMDFFEHQARARRRTGLLVFFYALAVLGVAGSVSVVVMLAVGYAERGSPGGAPSGGLPLAGSLAIGLVVSAGLVVGGAGFKLGALSRGGGRYIAERLGGSVLQPNTTDPVERKVLNVVEEMAIASGVPTPPVYMMHNEAGINAFAAGHKPGDAVIGVTRGAVELLSRDELQGVMAHEFSHILNGDMRLNLRLLGWLNGILVVGLLGAQLFRGAFYTGGFSSRRSNNSSGLPLIVVALAFAVIGAVGSFFASAIKAMVSREREFLADAAAVQFTRNPEGIAGALKKIGGHSHHALITNPKASEASHMYFGEGTGAGLTSLFATHPPLKVRIKRIQPDWDGRFPKVARLEGAQQAAAAGTRRPAHAHGRIMSELTGGGGGAAAGLAALGLDPGLGGDAAAPKRPPSTPGSATADELREAFTSAGQTLASRRAFAASLEREIDARFLEAAHDPFSARFVVLAMLLDEDERHRQTQLQVVAELLGVPAAEGTSRLWRAARAVPAQLRLPLLDRCIAPLRQLSREQHAAFRTAMQRVIDVDQRLDHLEWLAYAVVLHHLDGEQGFRPKHQRRSVYTLNRLSDESATVLGFIAAGAGSRERQRGAFEAGAAELPMAVSRPEKVRAEDVARSVDALRAAVPKALRGFVLAMLAAVTHDGEVTIEEAERFRGVCELLDIPVPPLVPGDAEATAAT